MEGDGRRLLVVIKRLQNDGIVLAVLNKQKSTPNTQLNVNDSKSYHKASVETNTVRNVNKHVQISNGRFASSYQVAHCRVSPSAPLNTVSEFPPQRNNFSYNESHFEVGGEGSRHHHPCAKSNHFRGGLTWPDRGAVYFKKSTRDADAFAHSLRKYPSPSPARSVLSELLVKHTKTKNTQAIYSPKASRKRSIHSLPTDIVPSRRPRKHSRQIQTYTRTYNLIEKVPMERRGRSTTRRKDKAKRVRETGWKESRKRVRSPRSLFLCNTRRKTEDNSTMYDYLAQSPPRASPVKHPREERKIHTRNVIQQMYQQNPVVMPACPKLKERLSEHKAFCPYPDKSSKVPMKKQSKGNAPLLCRLLDYLTNECDGTCCSKDFFKNKFNKKIRCPCTKSSKCDCESSESPQSPKCVWQTDLSCNCKETDKEYYGRRVYEEVAKWLNEIPVQSNECPENKAVRAELAEELAETIANMPDDENFQKNIKELIEKYIHNMAIWSPSSKREKQQLRNQLVDNLFDKITDIPRRQDKLRDVVKNLVDDLNITDGVNKKAIVNDIVENLKLFAANAPLQDEKYKDLLVSEIGKILGKIPMEFDGDKNMLINSLSNKLADDVIDALKDVDLSTAVRVVSKENLRDEFVKDISDWTHDFEELSNKLPSGAETKTIIDDLADKLDKLQVRGMNEKVRNKMENEIQTVLEDLNVTTNARNNLAAKLMDKVTDTVYVKEKEKLEAKLQQKTFEEVKKWLDHIQVVNNLNELELAKLVEDIIETIEHNRKRDSENYKNDILASIRRAGIVVDPTSIGKQVDILINKISTLPENVQTDILKNEVRKGLIDVINNYNIPKDTKDNLISKLDNMLDEHIEELSPTTERYIDNLEEILLEEMDCIFQELQLSKSTTNDLRDNVNNTLDNIFHNLKAATTEDKDNAKHAMLKDINYLIDKEPIPKQVKEGIKNIIKDIIDEQLDNPFSYDIVDALKENITNLIVKTEIENTVKDHLINKLKQSVSMNLSKVPDQSTKDYIKQKMLKSINLAVDKSRVPDAVKEDLKHNNMRMIEDSLQRPFTDEIETYILDNINEMINNAGLSRSVTDTLKAEIPNIVIDYLGKIPHQTDIDYVKSTVLKDMANVLKDEISLPRAELKELKTGIAGAFADALDQPYTEEERKKLIDIIYDSVDKLNLPQSKKKIITEKLLDIACKQLDQLPFQTKGDYTKDEIIRHVKENVKSLQVSSEKKTDLITKFEDKLEESVGEDLIRNREIIHDAISNILLDSGISQNTLGTFKNNIKTTADKILDNAFYTDDVRDYMRDILKNIDQSGISEEEKGDLKFKVKKMVDDIVQAPDFVTKKEQIAKVLNLNKLPPGSEEADVQEKIQDIISVIKKTPIPNNKKSIMLNKINNMANEVQDHQDLSKLIEELNKTIEELPYNNRRALQTKIAMIVDENSEEVLKRLKSAVLRDTGSMIDKVSLPTDKKNNLKQKIQSYVTGINKPLSSDVKGKLKDTINKIIDETVFSKDKKTELKNKVVNILKKIPTQEEFIKDTVIKVANKAIVAAAIRQQLKEDLKSQIASIVSILGKQPLNINAKANLINDVARVIDNAYMTPYQKDAFKRNLIANVTEEISKLPGTDDEEIAALLSIINNILDESQVSKLQKAELIKKIKKKLLTDNIPKVRKEIEQEIMNAIDKMITNSHLKAKLRNAIVNLKLPSQPESVLVDNIMNNICNQIDDAAIQQEFKTDLKIKLKDAVPECLKNNLDNRQLKEVINENITNIVDNAPLSRGQKEELKNNLVNTVLEVLTAYKGFEKPVASPRSYARCQDLPSPSKGILSRDSFLDTEGTQEWSMPARVKQQISSPSILKWRDTANVVPDKRRSTQTSITKDSIIEDIAPDRRDLTTSQTTKIKDKITTEFDKIIDNLDLSIDLKDQLRDDLVEYIDSGDDNLISKGKEPSGIKIAEILDDLPISRNQKNKLKTQIIDTIKKKTKHIGHKDRKDSLMEQKEKAKDTIIAEFDKVIEKLDLPRQMKEQLKSELADYLDANEGKFFVNGTDLSVTRIAEIVEDLPMPKKTKKELQKDLIDAIKKPIVDIAPFDRRDTTTSQITPTKDEVISEIDKLIDDLGLPKHIKEQLKREMRGYIDENEHNLIENAIDASGIKIGEIPHDLPVSSKMKHELQSKFIDAINKKIKPKDKKDLMEQKAKAKDTITAEFGKVIEKLDLPLYMKEQVKIGLADYLDANEDKLFVIGTDLSSTKIRDIIKELPLPKKIRRDLQTQLIDAIKKTTDTISPKITTEKKTMAKDAIATEIDRIIDRLDVPIEVKDQLANELIEYIEANEDNFIVKGKVASGIRIAEILNVLPVSKKVKRDFQNQIIEAIKKETQNIAPTVTTSRKLLTKDAITSKFYEIIDNLDLPEHIKEKFKSDLVDYIDADEDKLIIKAIDPSGIKIGKILEELPVTEKMKKELQSQFIGTIKKERKKPDNETALSKIQNTEIEDAITSEFNESDKHTKRPSLDKSSDVTGVLKTPHDAQIEVIQNWINSLPIDISNGDNKKLMNEIASDIADRQKYLQLFPEALKSTQDELDNLQYQVFRRLEKIFDDKDMIKVMQRAGGLMEALKEIESLKERSSEYLLNEGKAYKQALRDAISETMADLSDLSAADQTTFEALKEELVDAFIDLNFTGGTEEEIAVLKRRIHDEVSKFCDEYLKAHGTPLDRKALEQKLYSALKKVPLPSDETIRLEVDKKKQRDMIKNLLKSLPMEELTPQERLKVEKEAAILENELLKIHRNEAGLTEEEMEIAKQNLIKQFMKKVISDHEKTKATGSNRFFDYQRRPSFQRHDLRRDYPCQSGPCQTKPVERRPCYLLDKDKELLESIRQRTCMAPDCLSSLLNLSMNKSSVSIQTDKLECVGKPIHLQSGPSLRPCPIPCARIPRSVPRQSSAENVRRHGFRNESERETNPQIMKEFCWDSIEPQMSGMRHQEYRYRRPPCAYSHRCPRREHGQLKSHQRKPSISSQPLESIPYCLRPLGSPPSSPCRSSFNQNFQPPAHSTPRNSFGFNQKPEMRDSAQPEYTDKSSRKYRVINIGSLDDLSRPSKKVRQPENFAWSQIPGNDMSDEDYEEAEIPCTSRQTRPCFRSRAMPRYDMCSFCKDEDDKYCPKCSGVYCPYPSLTFFK